MILSTYQPYFAPFPGFFYKAYLSDLFVILDNVQFPRGSTWITRNRFKNDQGSMYITIPVWKKGLGLQNINQVRICNEGKWSAKHLKSLETAYANAPYLQEHIGVFEEIFSQKIEKIVDLNLKLIKHILHYLEIDTKIILLSNLGIKSKGTQLLVDICNKIGANRFLAQSSSKKYLDTNLFKKENISVEFIRPPLPVYPQLWGNFFSNLSIFDLLLNCGPKSRDILFS